MGGYYIHISQHYFPCAQTMTKKKPGNDDDDLFRRLMADVKPLATPARITPSKPPVSPHPKRRELPPSTTHHFVERQGIDNVAADEQLSFSHDGPQRRLLQHLRRGEIPRESRLDLHGQTIAEAGTALDEFLRNAQRNRHRCVLIVHGKGHRSPSGQPVLKAQLNRWLRDAPIVLAFHSARARDGGSGALYVLLRRDAN